jgi:hypothetical protein
MNRVPSAVSPSARLPCQIRLLSVDSVFLKYHQITSYCRSVNLPREK